MNNRIIGGLLALAGVGFLFLGARNIFHEGPVRSPGFSPSELAGPAKAGTTNASRIGNVATSGAASNPSPVSNLLPPSDGFSKELPTEPAFARFAEWAARYTQAPTAAGRAALQEEGVSLAQARLQAMADLIQSDPARALELKVPYEFRQIAPDAVNQLLEEKINTRGDYQVLGVLQDKDGDLPPVLRAAVIEGETYRVFTYGQQLQFVTKDGVPLNGIAVPASAASRPPGNALLQSRKIIALGPPARLLESAEVESLRRARPQEPICSSSGQLVASRGEETVVELGGDLHSFCGKVHAEDWVNARVAAAGLELPGGEGGLPTAESSYTEGRKRMLCLRPYWSDYTTMMTTNEALTHWVGFSNYMFQMSQGKLVFAPLGRGSDISREILMPGSVTTYSSGLGSIFTTMKNVAEANYGYVIRNYDFVYYCTKGQPSASYAGLGFVGGVGFHLANSYFDAATAGHEFGHNLGLNHAHFWDTAANSIIGTGQNVEYGDSNDPMGSGGNPNQYNARYRNYLGWIRDTDVADLNVLGSGVYRLYAFDLDRSSGLRGLKFRRDSSQNYWFNFRQRKTTKKALMNGLQLMWTGNGNQGSYLLDAQLKGLADDNAVVIGRTFSDPTLGFHVTPIGKGRTDPESIDVRVNIGTFPTNLPPSVIVNSDPAAPSPGQLVSFSATATDPNGDALAYYWEFGDGEYSIENSATTSHSFAVARDYAVQCTVSDMKGGTVRRSVLVRVGVPTTFRISGRVLNQQNLPLAGIRVSSDTGRSVFTDSDGSYTLTGLSGGMQNLTAVEPLAGALSFAHPFFNNPISVGPDYAGADFIGVPGSLNIYTPLSAKASTWRYLDTGANLGSAWTAPGFNDSTWSTGVAPLGYPSGSPIATVIGFGPNANSKYVTTYFRKAFVVPDPGAYTNLFLETLRDDGVVVYLNGTEIFRNNLPAGAINYLTAAIDTFEPDSYLQATLPRTLLVPGTNYLAAEVHQVEATSSDLALDVALSGLSVSNASGFNIVYVTSPKDQSGFGSPTNITVEATALSGAGVVSNVEFYLDGVKQGDDATPPFSLVLNNPIDGVHSLRVVAALAGSRSTSAPVVVNVSAPHPTVPAIALTPVALGSVWKYLAGPSAAPAGWTSLAFNDGAWPAGPAQLGYGDGDEATTLSFGSNAAAKWNTYYFRRAFLLNDPRAVTNLYVRLLRDDGAVVYLNGVEVFRSNMPLTPITYATAALNAPDDGKDFFFNSIDPALLVNGTNVVAVEVHQDQPASSDVTFDLALEARASTNRSRGLWLTSPADGSLVALPDGATLSVEAVVGAGLGVSRVEYFADEVKIGETLAAPFNFTWSNPPGGDHRLIAVATDTAGGVVTSAPVQVTVTPPPLGTALVSFGDVWKYRDDGSNLGTNWAGRSYNDNQWMAGPARLGYGGDGEITVVSFGTNVNAKPLTTYFRKLFTVANPAAFGGLLLRILRDDGVAVYLNGVEVYRNNLQPGPLSWNSLALTAVEGAAETTPVEVNLGLSGLLPGANVLAVEVHQASLSSSDLGFDLSLTGVNATNISEGIYLARPANGTHFNAPANVALAAYVATPDPVSLVEFFEGANRIAQADVYPYQAVWSGVPVGTHSIVARVTYGAGLQLTSEPISFTVGNPPPPIVPVFTTLVLPGAAWKYWDSAANVSSGWQRTAFDDTAWPAANARFGWGLDGELAPLTQGRITHYFRRWFTLGNGAQLTELLFELVRDDGAVVYLNGTEVFRSNMPGGPIDPGTLAAATVDTPDETTWFETLRSTAGSGLVGGSNLVAVELHQSSATSSDASFDFALFGQGTTERRLYLSSPANGSSVANTSAIRIEAMANAGTGFSTTRVEFFADGEKLGESSFAPYRFNWIGATYGVHVLVARLTDNSGAVLDSAPVTLNVTRELVSTLLIPSNSVWKYLDTGVNQGTSWSQPAFNDSAWASGPARLGFGGDGEATLINGGPSNARYPTIYFRRAVVVPSGAVYTNLAFKLARDDGAVVYLNGREVFRSNIGTGTVLYNTLAASATDEQTFYPTTVVVTNLPAGTNVIAVEIHQSSTTSSDLGFNLELVASGYLESTAPPPLSGVFSDDKVELSWPAMSSGWQFIQAPSPETPDVAWTPAIGSLVQVGGRNVFSVLPLQPKQFYRLVRP